ncbi:hypothetical protein CCUS01_12209 [Colletotrichum cuscutae]|uniref:Heterokaryon incompatibility domain-containing protein n=1 Tax=Colletotrichum cuscutae TaxID=1209917 RepID=A0AAI9TXL3_9PEZI|nr:hypothetical protein CCUS01_12209 [Colletotrichum cuscutae]
MSANDTQFFKQSLRSEYWINFNVDKKFSLAGVDEPELDSEDKELVRTWASTKGATKTAPGQTQSSSLYRPILDPFEIRVLEILPGTGDDRLRGRLRHCSLELEARFALAVDGSATPIVYTALSYTWGPNVFDEAIECEGHVKNMTKSLAVALRAFRQEDRSVVMWIDQICINQDDNEEKAQQIPLMSRIYQNAMNTVIWLGESTSNSASAIKLLEDVRLLLQFTEKIIGPDEFEGLNLPSESSEVWKALWDFLSRPWFTRLWIIQEVILSFDSWVDRSAIRPSYADEFPVTHLYRDITIRHLDNNKGSLRLGVVLTCVDHESIDLPSWVPDWRNPRRTHSLGHSTTTTTPYMACGHLTIEIGRVHPPLERKNKDELRLHGVSVDAIAKVSTVFTNPELSLEDPITANGDLKDMCSFVAELQEYPGNETVFSAFWQTLVAGKDATEMAKAPIAYEEIVSLLLDASTGLSPSLPGQTYSARQSRPAGKGKLELANLKTRTAGKTFQDEQENPIILPSIEFSPAVKVESSPHVVPLSSSPHNPPAEASAIDHAPSEASPVFDQLAQASSVIAPPVHFHHPGIPPVRAFAPLDQNPPLINAVDRTPSAVNPRPVIEARALNPPALLPPLPTRRGNAPPTQPGPSIPQIADPSHVGNPPPPNPGPRGRFSFQGLTDICQGMEAEILSNALGNTKARDDEGSFKTPLEYAVIRRIKTTMMVNRHTAVAEQTRIEDDFRKLSSQEQSRPIMKMSGSLNDMMRGFDR